MVTITAAGTGNWKDGTTWTGGVKPGNNDVGSIPVGVVVTVSEAAQAANIELDGGAIVFNADFTFTDVGASGIIIQDKSTCSLTSNGTPSSPRLLKSASTTPTNPWRWYIDSMDGADARVINLDNIECRGMLFFLGDAVNYVNFNGGGVDDPVCLPMPPLTRDVQLEEHKIRGRDQARTYPGYHAAGTITIVGYCTLNSRMWQIIVDMDESDSRLAFVSQYISLPHCRIESYRFRARGGQYLDFSITLREDA